MLVLPNDDINTDAAGAYHCSAIEVKDQLRRILSNSLFDSSTILSNFLKFVVEQALAGNGRNLKEYTIGVSALGRRPDFNPKVDAIVRIHAGRLRRLLDEYYSGPGLLDPVQIDLVKGSYAPAFRRRMLPSDMAVKNNEEPVFFTRNKIAVAVLPFRNLSEGSDFQFFADGLGEEFSRVFGTFQEITVIAHQSTLRYKTGYADVRTIGADLGANYLISGSVFRDERQVRINVSLIDAANGAQAWANTYTFTYTLRNLVQIQEEVTHQVFSILGGYYGQIVRSGAVAQGVDSTAHVETVDALLWNYYLHMNFSLEVFLKTRDMMEAAVRSDPNYATGLASLADIYLIGHTLGFPVIENPVAESLNMLQRALALDAENQFAWAVSAWAHLLAKRPDEAVRHVEHCLSLEPSAPMLPIAGFLLVCAGRYDKGMPLLADALQANIHHPWWFDLGLFLGYIKKKQYRKAYAVTTRLNVPDVFLDPLVKLVACHKVGMDAEAREFARQLTHRFGHIAARLHDYIGFLGDESLTDDLAADLALYLPAQS